MHTFCFSNINFAYFIFVSELLKTWTGTILMYTNDEKRTHLWGSLGVRSVVSLAPSTYLASAVSTVELTTSLLAYRLRDVVDSGIATAMSAWSQSATSPSTTSIAPRQSPSAPPSLGTATDSSPLLALSSHQFHSKLKTFLFGQSFPPQSCLH